MNFKKTDAPDGAVRSGDVRHERIAWCLIALFGFMILSYAFLGPITRGEWESNEFPVISLQYRGSIFLNESDIAHIQKDFPQLYPVAQDSRHLYWHMVPVAEDSWYYYYFPIYPLLCLPLKLVFQFLRVDQERCFTVTNALLTIISLCFVQRRLKVPAKQRLAAVALLMASPLIYNVNFAYYMAFMFSFVTMSLVQYYNRCYKSSALLLSVAGMSNPTIMVVGLVMIAEYLVKTARQYRQEKNWTWGEVRAFLFHMMGYGLCYVPCLAQFVVNLAVYPKSSSPLGLFGGYKDTQHWFARFLMYLFDPTLGFGTFAPLVVIVFFALVVVGVVQRKLRVLIWASFLLGTVAAFSLMSHINCGMSYCARYIIFTWPIIPLFLATDGFEILKPVVIRRTLYPVLILSCCFLLCVNFSINDFYAYAFDYNTTTRWILKNVPQLYAPYSATFYCRTLHIDGAYDITNPAYYFDPQTDEVRKLIYKADEGQAEQVLYDLTGDETSVSYLKGKLEKNGTDGKFHYINFPASGAYQVREKTREEKGELVNITTVVDEHNLAVGYPDAGLYVFPFTIKEKTIYKIEISLGTDTAFSIAKDANMVVDFCGPNYDRAEQEAARFIQDGKYDYVFYFDSGEMDNDTLDGWVRMFTYADTGRFVNVQTLRVTEMARVQ